MKYGQVSPAQRMNALIYKCFEYVTEADARKFAKQFSDQPHEGSQVLHSVVELVLGAYMCSQKLPVNHDVEVDGKTPDWCLQNPDVNGLIELVNFHASKATEDEVNQALRERNVVAYWPGPNTERLYSRIWEKASAYKEIVDRRGIPYVVAVFCDIKVDVDAEEVNECVSAPETGLFALYPSLSGVVFIVERVGYMFSYCPNPHAIMPFAFPEGTFDWPIDL